MPENLSPPHALAMRKAGYLLALLTPLLMPAGLAIGARNAPAKPAGVVFHILDIWRDSFAGLCHRS